MTAAPGGNQVKAMARLARILATLDNAGSVGASADQLLAIAEYGGTAAVEDQLSLDLRNLRKQGWQIDNVAGVGERARYRMIPGDNRLRVRLTSDQQAALQRAVILADRAGLAKRLGVRAGELPDGLGTQVLPHEQSTQLSLSLMAVQLHSLIRFTYNGSARVVRPGRVRFQNNRWYLSGLEEGQDQLKHFAVNRMTSASLDSPGTAAPIQDPPRLQLHPLAWEVNAPIDVTLRTPTEHVPDLVRWLREPARREDGDGGVELVYTVTHRAAFRARLYVLGPRVSVVGPSDFRDELLSELRQMVAQ